MSNGGGTSREETEPPCAAASACRCQQQLSQAGPQAKNSIQVSDVKTGIQSLGSSPRMSIGRKLESGIEQGTELRNSNVGCRHASTEKMHASMKYIH